MFVGHCPEGGPCLANLGPKAVPIINQATAEVLGQHPAIAEHRLGGQANRSAIGKGERLGC
jgi:hypothetical protein